MKRIWLKIIAVILMIVSVRGIFFVLTNTEFDYNGLPLYAVYLILSAVILLTLFTGWKAFFSKRQSKAI